MPDSAASYLFDEPHVLLERVVHNIADVILGKRDRIELVVTALLCGGHILLEDVPGVGKTMLVRALAKTVDCAFKRIQFTPDLLPSDITGLSIYNRGRDEFEFRPGPLFANIVLADELNRTSPRTQSALLEAMEEKQVTADGETYPLPQPFLLIATQNPLGQEGTYSLPEAQMDRFFMRIRLGYPDAAHELGMLGRLQESHPVERLKPVLRREELAELQRRVRGVHVDEALKRYIVGLVSSTREHREIALGASPRASLSLMQAAQARAFRLGRDYAVPDDIQTLSAPVLAHRLILSAEARLAGRSGQQVVEELVRRTPIPSARELGRR